MFRRDFTIIFRQTNFWKLSVQLDEVICLNWLCVKQFQPD